VAGDVAKLNDAARQADIPGIIVPEKAAATK
jgi:hypothetical protein